MSVGRTRLGKPKPESMILLQVWHVPVHFTKICSGCVVHLHIMFTCQVAWCSLFRWLGPPSPGLEAVHGVFTSTHRPRGLTTVLVHNQSQEAWTWNNYLQVTFFTGYFFLQVTWSVSSPSVAGRDGVPTGFAEVAQPVQISQIQQGLIGSHCNLPDVTINAKKYHG